VLYINIADKFQDAKHKAENKPQFNRMSAADIATLPKKWKNKKG
jgi:hypothetical protein